MRSGHGFRLRHPLGILAADALTDRGYNGLRRILVRAYKGIRGALLLGCSGS